MTKRIRQRLKLVRSRELTLGEFLERFAQIRGNSPLAEEPDGFRVTYREAADLVARAAGALRGRVAPGDRVLIEVPNGYRLFLTCLAVCRAGGIAVPVNSRMTPAEIAHVVADAEVVLRIDDFDALAVGGKPLPEVRVDPESVAAVLYTSGTTGLPKGAELTHRAFVGASGIGAAAPEGLFEPGCVTGMPVAHIAGMTLLLMLAAIGIPVYLLPHFRPINALEAIERQRPIMFVGVPAMYRMMLEAGASDRDLSSVRLWASGADTLPDDVVAVFQRMGHVLKLPASKLAIGRATFVDGYGMVELGGGVAVRVFPPFFVPGRSLMRALPGHRVRLVDAAGTDVPRGEVGEIAVRGRGVMRGYHHQTVATDDVFTPDGWLRTGDLARARGLGFFELVGRKKDVVKHGGFSVFSVEVERVLESHPAVAEAAVLGEPDERTGEIPVAAVRMLDSASVTPEALRAFATERLSDYKVPQRIFVLETLPRTATGKVNKPQLKVLIHAHDLDAPA